MRSEIIYCASDIIRNRYELCKTCAVATRRLHVPSNRIPDTINIALEALSKQDKTQALSAAIVSLQKIQHQRLH
jgi:hypothetical protein